MKKTIIILTGLMLLAAQGYSQEEAQAPAAQGKDEVSVAEEAVSQDKGKDSETSQNGKASVKETAVEAKRKIVAAAKQTGPVLKKAAVEVKEDIVSATKKVGEGTKEAVSNVKEEVKKITK